MALIAITTFLLLFPMTISSPESDALLKLKASLINTAALSTWAPNTPPCAGDKPLWIGLRCSNDTLSALQLENMALSGTIDVAALASLPDLRSVSFQDNNFSGPMPDLGRLGVLKAVFLSRNGFSGEIPADAFAGMGSLKKVYLSDNNFTGNIPASLASLPRLLELGLEKNGFSGEIPDFKQNGIQKCDFSYNQLSGPIPAGLRNMNSSSFIGNKGLCGKPLDNPCGKPLFL